MEKPNKKPIVSIIICVVAVLAVAGVAIWLIVKNNNGGSENTGESTSQTTARVTSSELLNATPAVKIAYGDFSAMQTLSKDIQNGKMTGQIVSIDGLVNHPGNSYSIVQANADGTTKIGTVFNIDDDSTYPADGTRITIVAKVVEVSPLNFQLVTLKNFVKAR